jgi:ubiquinone/menaquinone biosynthesis C-methylase UbiE
MSFLISLFYDRAMAGVEAACLAEWRQALVSQATGAALEIGAGTGANLPFYPPEMTSLVVSEPDDNMRQQLLQKLSHADSDHISASPDTAEALSAPDNAYDTVVLTLVCCSVGNLDAALAEIHRVLKPTGKFIFLEHVGAAEGSSRRKWQNRVTPVWRKVAGNCHLNRDTEQAILRAGFTFQSIERESMRKAVSLVRPTIRGVAVKSVN